jgi:hypothetical protein
LLEVSRRSADGIDLLLRCQSRAFRAAGERQSRYSMLPTEISSARTQRDSASLLIAFTPTAFTDRARSARAKQRDATDNAIRATGQDPVRGGTSPLQHRGAKNAETAEKNSKAQRESPHTEFPKGPKHQGNKSRDSIQPRPKAQIFFSAGSAPLGDLCVESRVRNRTAAASATQAIFPRSGKPHRHRQRNAGDLPTRLL